MPRADRAELGNGDLPLGQHLEEKRLERLVGAIDFVDEQHRRPVPRDRLEQRPLQQEPIAEHVRLTLFEARSLFLAQPRVEHLARIVPFVERRHRVQSFVALQADELGAEHLGQHLRAFGLADARRPLDEQWLLEREHNLERSSELLVDDEAALAEPVVDGRRVCHECDPDSAWGSSRNFARQLAQQK